MKFSSIIFYCFLVLLFSCTNSIVPSNSNSKENSFSSLTIETDSNYFHNNNPILKPFSSLLFIPTDTIKYKKIINYVNTIKNSNIATNGCLVVDYHSKKAYNLSTNFSPIENLDNPVKWWDGVITKFKPFMQMVSSIDSSLSISLDTNEELLNIYNDTILTKTEDYVRNLTILKKAKCGEGSLASIEIPGIKHDIVILENSKFIVINDNDNGIISGFNVLNNNLKFIKYYSPYNSTLFEDFLIKDDKNNIYIATRGLNVDSDIRIAVINKQSFAEEKIIIIPNPHWELLDMCIIKKNILLHVMNGDSSGNYLFSTIVKINLQGEIAWKCPAMLLKTIHLTAPGLRISDDEDHVSIYCWRQNSPEISSQETKVLTHLLTININNGDIVSRIDFRDFICKSPNPYLKSNNITYTYNRESIIDYTIQDSTICILIASEYVFNEFIQNVNSFANSNLKIIIYNFQTKEYDIYNVNNLQPVFNANLLKISNGKVKLITDSISMIFNFKN